MCSFLTKCHIFLFSCCQYVYVVIVFIEGILSFLRRYIINSFIPYCEGYDGIPFFLSYILVVENRFLLGGKIPHEGVVTSS